MESGTLSRRSTPRPGAGRLAVPAALLALAAAGWWWSARSGADMAGATDMSGAMGMDDPMSAWAFGVAWLAMMAAMMLPAALPVILLYRRAAARGRVAPTAVFVSGYLAVWLVPVVPAYVAWRWLEMPLAEGRPWAAQLAGATLLVAAVWQLTPLKHACLRRCRSPMSTFLRAGRSLSSPLASARAGGAHALFCVGCCWTVFAVLVAVGTMELAWMAALAAFIAAEKVAPRPRLVGGAGALVFAVLGGLLIVQPSLLTHLT